MLCFTGDGAFLYHLGELETARRWGINTVTVVNNNSMYAQTVRGADAAYGAQMGQRQELYQFLDLDFARIAEAMGCVGIRVERPNRIRRALIEALSTDDPVVVDIVTDGHNPAPWTRSSGEAVQLH